MKKFFLFTVTTFLFAQSVWALENISLASGESVLIGSYRVSCAGSAQQAKLYRCSLGAFKVFFSDWKFDLDEAKQQAQDRCRAGSHPSTVSACFVAPNCKEQ